LPQRLQATPRVGGGSAFYVRPHDHAHKTLHRQLYGVHNDVAECLFQTAPYIGGISVGIDCRCIYTAWIGFLLHQKTEEGLI
jgi:hypothetical protein